VEGNRVYIAGKVGKEGAVRELIAVLEKRGYFTPFDWTTVSLEKPFKDDPSTPASAERMMRGAIEADIVVVLCQKEGGIGYHIETGAAIASCFASPFALGGRRKRVYAVGEGNDRSAFYFHPAVTRVDTVESLLALFQP
jgi:hypothetical protein